MDPQRQYAQLLTLWSEGSKVFRRKAFLTGDREEAWELWWRIGRRLVERGLMVLPMPLAVPSLFVATENRWWTLIDEQHVSSEMVHGQVIAVRTECQPALSWTGYWGVSVEMILRMGEHGFSTLIEWPTHKFSGELSVDALDHAVTLIGALHRTPALFHALALDDWVTAARLVRHSGMQLKVSNPLPREWGFRYDTEQHLAWFERQDEDSVHKR